MFWIGLWLFILCCTQIVVLIILLDIAATARTSMLAQNAVLSELNRIRRRLDEPDAL